MIWSVFLLIVALLAAGPLPVSAAAPDTVLEWFGIMNTTVLAGGTNPLVSTRVVALVSASVFDAVNGIDPRFRPLHVEPAVPHNASQRAAAIQAAYVILVDLYPKQGDTLMAQRDASVAALASTEKAQSIAAGVAWGQTVADAIWAWRLTDGIAPAPPPFLGVQSIVGTQAAIGAWRPTPQGLPNQLPGVSGAGPQFATMTPWVLTRPSQFRLPPPPALNSPEYAADLDELFKMVGSGVVLGGEHTTLLESHCRPNLNRTRAVVQRECTPICLAECLDGRRRNRVLGWQVPLRFLATDLRDSGRVHPCGFGPSLDTLAGLLSGRHSSASRVSLGPFHGEWFSRLHPRRRVWREHGV
jgi:hypothetical protein